MHWAAGLIEWPLKFLPTLESYNVQNSNAKKDDNQFRQSQIFLFNVLFISFQNHHHHHCHYHHHRLTQHLGMVGPIHKSVAGELDNRRDTCCVVAACIMSAPGPFISYCNNNYSWRIGEMYIFSNLKAFNVIIQVIWLIGYNELIKESFGRITNSSSVASVLKNMRS